MITYNEALNIIKGLSPNISIGYEDVGLFEAQGRISAFDILSKENIPAADNSAMDGFAVRSRETSTASKATPISLRVEAVIAAGDINKENTYPENTCVEIMTGGITPSEFDSVVKVEDVTCRAGHIVLTEPIQTGSNIRPKGTDFSIEQLVISKNVVLQEQHLMALAALGISHVKVKNKLKVAVVSTGNEIVPYEQTQLNSSQVRNSSAPFLKMFLERNHCSVTLFGILGDDRKQFLKLMQDLLKGSFDLIITTGAVSMGKWDFITNALPDLKMKTHFHKVAIRPGKPLLFAQSEDMKTVFFGLPGNPISTAVGVQFFVRPLVEEVLQIKTQEKWAKLKVDASKPEGLECFFKAKLEFEDVPIVEALKGQASYMIHSFVNSNSWVQLSAPGTSVKAGEKVRVYDL